MCKYNRFDLPHKIYHSSGIYKIHNTISNKFYIGSAFSFGKRFNKHINDLLKNKHHNKYLQNSFNIHGENAFVFSVIEIVDDPINLISIEQNYIDILKPYDRNIGYNICLIANNRTGVKESDESRFKRSIIQTEVMSRPDIIKKTKETNMSDYTKTLRSIASSGRKWFDDSRKKHSENRTKLIRESGGFSEITKKRMSDSKIGKTPKNLKPVSRYTLDNEYIDTFDCVSVAVREMEAIGIKILPGKISMCLSGKRNKTCGYIWKY